MPKESDTVAMPSPEVHARGGLGARLLRNALSNWGAFVVEGASAFLLTPILIHGLGDLYYGMYILVASLVEYYGLLDIGLRNTLQRFVARYEGEGDRRAQDETFATAVAFGAGMSVLICLASVPLAVLLPGFFHLQDGSRPVFSQLVSLLGLTVGVSFLARLVGAYLLGLQRFDLYNRVVILTALLRVGMFIALLRLGYGVLAIALASVGLAVLSLLLYVRLARTADPQLTFRWRMASRQRMRELIRFSIWVFLARMGDQLRYHMSSVIIGRWLSVALITPFSVANRLLTLFRGVLYGALTPLTPAMSKLEGEARHEDLRQLFLRSTRVSALLSCLIGLLLIFNGRSILRLWVGEGLVSAYPVLVILTVAYVSDFAQMPSGQLLYARGRPEVVGWMALAEGAVNVGLSIFLAVRYGLTGVALGTLAPMLVNKLLVQNIFTLRAAAVTPMVYFRQSFLGPLAASAVFAAVCGLAGVASMHHGLLGLAVHLGWQVALFGSLAALLGLTAQERRMLIGGLKRLADRFRPARTD